MSTPTSGGMSPEFEAKLAAMAQKLEAEGALSQRDPLAAPLPFAPYIESERCPIDNADQPPEVDVHDDAKRLPPPESAAKRVIEFISWWGDGQINEHEAGPPLYARDLSAIASAVLATQAEP